jgi:anti-sigma B factor antagonist
MNIKISEDRDRTVITISGEIDMYTSPELREKIMSFVKLRVLDLSIDFQKVSYIDSSGIATFVEGLKCMKKYGGRLRFFNIPAAIMEIFRFSKLDKVFDISNE